jgi:hypothetical protein
VRKLQDRKYWGKLELKELKKSVCEITVRSPDVSEKIVNKENSQYTGKRRSRRITESEELNN